MPIRIGTGSMAMLHLANIVATPQDFVAVCVAKTVLT